MRIPPSVVAEQDSSKNIKINIVFFINTIIELSGANKRTKIVMFEF